MAGPRQGTARALSGGADWSATSCDLTVFLRARDRLGPFQIAGPVTVEPSDQLCRSQRSAVSAVVTDFLEEVALTQRPHRNGKVGHALMGCEGLCQRYE